MPTPWNELPLWKKVFAIVVSLIAVGGFEYVMLHDWSTSHMLVKVIAVVFNVIIAGVLVSIIAKKG